jgi:uncharacterized OB-fold protein
MATAEFLLPAPDHDSEPFWEGCRRGELLVQACGSCGRRRFPPRPMCPWCRSADASSQPMSGRGRVWSFVVVHPPLLPAYAELAPYNVIVVELDDDPSIRMVGNLVPESGGPINEIDPHSVQIGEAVRVVFDRVSDDIAMPRWTRVG